MTARIRGERQDMKMEREREREREGGRVNKQRWGRKQPKYFTETVNDSEEANMLSPVDQNQDPSNCEPAQACDSCLHLPKFIAFFPYFNYIIYARRCP